MNTEAQRGLTQAEAERLRAEGRGNIMPKSREDGLWMILCRNLFTLFNLLNVALACLLAWTGHYRDMLFMGVVVSNMLIGTVQEIRAKRMHDRLQLLHEGRVGTIRDGELHSLTPQELVLGDVVRLVRGEQVPADAVVLSGEAQLDESLLTGESVPVEKRAGEVIYSGSYLSGGSVVARLTAVGAESYAGKLQLAARKVRRAKSELMLDMRRIIRVVSVILVPVGTAVFLRQLLSVGLPLGEAVRGTVASVIGMIPEGLMLLTSISLAAGVIKLGRRSVMVNELYGIETLARTDVVCMDKTGTLTSGEMTLEKTVALAREEGIGDCVAALLSTFAESTPTNRALAEAFGAWNGEKALQMVPFSSERKWSAARFDGLGTLVLGAPEQLLTGEMLEQAQIQAADGLRVLALLRTDERLNGQVLPGKLEPMALLCLRDSLRPNVQETIRYFGEQDVMLKVISGDSPLTVSRTACLAGVPGAEKWVDMDRLREKDYAFLAREYTVFGRVSPEDKRGLIEALKADGHGVAMIGDGVNDIPALKAADCSIAMAGGSDAACRVAQLTLMTADFEIMPQIVLEGRRVINNITRAASLFLVKTTFSLILSVVMMLLPLAYPFAPIQLTLVSSLTIGIPSFVLALQPSSERVRGRFLRNVIARALPGGICAAVLVLAWTAASRMLGFTAAQAATLSTCIAGYSGLVALTLTCLPLNGVRTALLALMSVLFALAVWLIPGVFYLTPFTPVQWMVLAAAGVLAPALQLVLGRVIVRNKKTPEALAASGA